jgi:hypothetical protein
MPVRIHQLSRREEAEYLIRLQQMQAEGIAVEIPERWLEKARSLDIFVAGGPATFIFDMPGGGAAFAIWVRLVARRLVTLLEWAMTTAWDDQIVPQAFFDERTPLWRLGQKVFPQREVLNMRIMDALTLNPGRKVEGCLLAVGLKPMPEAFHHGMTAPFTLELWDQYENVIPQDAELFVDRTCKPKNKFVRQESGLYSPDQTSAIIEPALRPNLNRGRVPDPDAERLKTLVVRTEPESEAMASLKKAISELSPS